MAMPLPEHELKIEHLQHHRYICLHFGPQYDQQSPALTAWLIDIGWGVGLREHIWSHFSRSHIVDNLLLDSLHNLKGSYLWYNTHLALDAIYIQQ
jgi:hypothetical protein